MSTDTHTAEWLQQALALRPAETPFPWQEELLARFIDGKVPRDPVPRNRRSGPLLWPVLHGLVDDARRDAPRPLSPCLGRSFG